jgi:FemAB-related protein (PEP-CTERM system-associated)
MSPHISTSSLPAQERADRPRPVNAVPAADRAEQARADRPGPVRVFELRPELHAHWQEYVRCSPRATLFHDLGWMRAVQSTYGHRPHYLLAQSAQTGAIRGVLPLFLVSGPFTGRALISMPYAVYGGVVADDVGAEAALVTEAKHLSERTEARYTELRQELRADGFAVKGHYFTFRTRMPKDAKEVLARYPRKSRAAIRQAIDKFGLKSQFGHELLGEFYRTYLRSLRRLGSPPHRRRFFQRLLDEFGERCIVQVVYHDQEPAAGCVSLVYRNQILPYFAGIDDRYSRLNTSNYLYFALMQHAVGMGLEIFDFGRTRRDNEGGCQFKINQGFEPEPLDYSFHAPDGGQPPDLRPSNPKFSLAQAVWRRLPLAAVSLFGGILTRWLP